MLEMFVVGGLMPHRVTRLGQKCEGGVCDVTSAFIVCLFSVPASSCSRGHGGFTRETFPAVIGQRQRDTSSLQGQIEKQTKAAFPF